MTTEKFLNKKKIWQALPTPKPQAHEHWTQHEEVDEADGGERSRSATAAGGGRGGRKGGKKNENRIAGLKNEGATCYLNAVIQVICSFV